MTLYRLSGWLEPDHGYRPHPVPGLVAWQDWSGWPDWSPPPPGATTAPPQPPGPMHVRVVAIVDVADIGEAVRVLKRAWPRVYRTGEAKRYDGAWRGHYRPAPVRREGGR